MLLHRVRDRSTSSTLLCSPTTDDEYRLLITLEMPKAEISWKRVTAEGVRIQVYARHVGRDWRFFARERRYDRWQAVERPPLEDWLELLDAVHRLINRRRLRPEEEDRVRKTISEQFPEPLPR